MAQIKKVLKQSGDLRLLELETPVYGGKYAVETSSIYKDGLCLEAAKEIYSILEKLTK